METHPQWFVLFPALSFYWFFLNHEVAFSSELSFSFSFVSPYQQGICSWTHTHSLSVDTDFCG